MHRRSAIKGSLIGIAGTVLVSQSSITTAWDEFEPSKKMKNNIHHSVCRWTYSEWSLEQLCLLVKKIGFSAIDLIGPKEWNILKKYGIDSSMCNGAEISLVKGWNDTQYHETLTKNYTEHIDLVSQAGYKNLICFSRIYKIIQKFQYENVPCITDREIFSEYAVEPFVLPVFRSGF